jgi:hypothetical protein
MNESGGTGGTWRCRFNAAWWGVGCPVDRRFARSLLDVRDLQEHRRRSERTRATVSGSNPFDVSVSLRECARLAHERSGHDIDRKLDLLHWTRISRAGSAPPCSAGSRSPRGSIEAGSDPTCSAGSIAAAIDRRSGGFTGSTHRPQVAPELTAAYGDERGLTLTPTWASCRPRSRMGPRRWIQCPCGRIPPARRHLLARGAGRSPRRQPRTSARQCGPSVLRPPSSFNRVYCGDAAFLF